MLDLEFIELFARSNEFGRELPGGCEMLAREQLRSLWTAYCIVRDLEPDTLMYDVQLRELWMALIENREIYGSSDVFDDVDCFDMYMGELLC